MARLRYVEANFLFFSVCVGDTWEIITRDPSQDRKSTKQAIEDEFDIELEGPSLWDRWSLVLLIAVVLTAWLLLAA
ncbi:MAG: hypothetical protein GY708_20365 [Actinomycetia bacterium]|nr:hypothetical protein [Actinomycetes bacterium]